MEGSPLPMLSPPVVLAPAKPRNPEKRAEAKITWRLGQDQAELRRVEVLPLEPQSLPTNQPPWGPVCDSPAGETQRRSQALIQAAPV